jgi:hypothetical protein
MIWKGAVVAQSSTIPAFYLDGLKMNYEEPVGIACNPADILTEETPNISPTRYCYTNLLVVRPCDWLSN